MQLNVARVRQCLKDFNFTKLFVEELGWDCYGTVLEVTVDGRTYTLAPVAEKRGMVAYVTAAGADNGIPDYPTRRKIDHQVTKSAREHLLIFTDAAKTTQVWQWVKREPRKPTACRPHTFHRDQPGDALIQKLQAVAFGLEEEAALTLVDVTSRVRAGFDIAKVTKRFYEFFKTEHAAFLKFLKGIPDGDMQRWYVSVMLNRLMFIYFVQKKGFLDADQNYLRSKLAASKARGKDRFYRDFLCPLFFEGFAQKESDRSAAVNKLLGKVPYLNGGLFLKHQIEELHARAIDIADPTFERLFDFFDRYHWHLDERPLRQDNEINPDVLGYIFEKYINQKQMGAYYTKEDITGYISRNTVIPFLFDAAKPKCKIAFDGEQSIWRLLAADPDRYIYASMRRGVIDDDGQAVPETSLPEFVRKGMDDPKARMFNRDYNLRQAVIPGPDGANLALPTETWREYVERRKRCLELRAKLARGEVRDINDLITLNLDIEQFAHDVIENCEGPELLRAFWHAILQVTVLDPTCGSGAFLFAVLNILESLYEACLDRMEVFLDELDRSGEKHRPEKFADFRKVLDRVGKHPNRKYFIYKSIILNNLYGVDIMEEAVEICKLRLFLKLVAQIDRPDQIEPLPDIDFNIRAGNTLVGYATYEQVKKAVQSKLDFDNALARIEEKAKDVDRLFGLFRQQQGELGGTVTATDKQTLRDRLGELESELNRYLATDYAIDPSKKASYSAWLCSHKPFHWFVEFYGIMRRNGFDVVVGNPPYVELSNVLGEYSVLGLTLSKTGNLYALCVERCSQFLTNTGRLGMITPISAVSTPRMLPLMRLIAATFHPLHISNFAVRPGKLFVGVDMNLTIFLGQMDRRQVLDRHIFTTRYTRWQEQFREFLFNTLAYSMTELELDISSIPKLGSPEAISILAAIRAYPRTNNCMTVGGEADIVHYHSGGRYFRKCIREKLSNEYKELRLNPGFGDAAICLLSSSLYYWFWIAISDCYHVTKRDVESMPFSPKLAEDKAFNNLASQLLCDLKKNSSVQVRKRADGTQQREVSFHVGLSRQLLDEIDRLLARYYHLNDNQVDWLLGFDAKYRGSVEDA